MAFNVKKYLDSTGVTHLWSKIETELDKKVNSVSATANKGIEIGGTANAPTVGIKLSATAGNALGFDNTDGGLYYAPAAADTYTIEKDETSSQYAAVYQLKKLVGGTGTGVPVGAAINIPKDMVVQSGTVETKTETGAWGAAGTYIHLVLANAANSDLYIPADSLIEYVTSGSQAGDMVVINVSNDHKVTATITDGTVTKAKLALAVQTSLGKADTALQKADIATGSANGTIAVGGDDVAVKGLGSAAYAATSDFDAAGAANTAKSEVIGASTDAKTANTIYGAKAYADDVAGTQAQAAYDAIIALTNTEIDTAIAAATNA